MKNANINCKCGGQGKKSQWTEDYAKCSCGAWYLLPIDQRPQADIEELTEAVAELLDDNAGNLAEG